MTANYIKRWSSIVEKWKGKKRRAREPLVRTLTEYIATTFLDAFDHPRTIRNKFLKNERVILIEIKKMPCKPGYAWSREQTRLHIIREAIADARVLVAMRR